MEESDQAVCSNCHGSMSEPYVLCMECRYPDVCFCLHCFAKGRECGDHLNCHSYTIIKNDFPVFGNSWTAAEEVKLLEAMADCGYGNWSDVSQQLRSKNKVECEQHYNSTYIDKAQSPLPELSYSDCTTMAVPVVFKLSEDPPRPPENSPMFYDMGGYMAARGDFNVEHDNFMELDIRDISFEENLDELEKELKLTVLDIYERCLQERQKRKRVIRKYGLINLKKLNVINRRYEKTIKLLIEDLRVFTRLLEPIEFDQYIEGLHHEEELRQNIKRLQEYHMNGITELRNIKMYKVLKYRQEQERSRRHLLTDILSHLQDRNACQSWLQRQAVLENISKGVPIPLPALTRRTASPLDIVGMPGYEKLETNEKELCAIVRLVPEAYLEFKNLLMNECKRHGCLKLAQARSLIKIDVNKTRKLYDFLLSASLINKDPI